MIIYTACDQTYFDEFAKTLVNSIHRNTDCECAIHVFDPRPDQLDWLKANRVNYTFEHTDTARFVQAAEQLTARANEVQLKRTLNAMGKGNDADLASRMRKTYYACARFIALSNLLLQETVFAIDVDALVRRPIDILSDFDFYLHQVTGKNARYLAGGMYLNPASTSRNFIQHYSQLLKEKLDQNYLYWSMDQDVLDVVVPHYQCGQLPMRLIDWNMQPDSAVWTAKGTRKNLESFINEKKLYTS